MSNQISDAIQRLYDQLQEFQKPVSFDIPGDWPGSLAVGDKEALRRIGSQGPEAIAPGGSLYRTMDDIPVADDFSESLRSRIAQLADEINNSPLQRDTSQLQNQMAILMKLYGQGQEQLYEAERFRGEQDERGRQAERWGMEQEVLRGPEGKDIIASGMTPAYVSRNARDEKKNARKLIMDQVRLFEKEFMDLEKRAAEGAAIPGGAENPYAKLFSSRKEIMQALQMASAFAEAGDTDRAMAILYSVQLKLGEPGSEAPAAETPAPAARPTTDTKTAYGGLRARHLPPRD